MFQRQEEQERRRRWCWRWVCYFKGREGILTSDPSASVTARKTPALTASQPQNHAVAGECGALQSGIGGGWVFGRRCCQQALHGSGRAAGSPREEGPENGPGPRRWLARTQTERHPDFHQSEAKEKETPRSCRGNKSEVLLKNRLVGFSVDCAPLPHGDPQTRPPGKHSHGSGKEDIGPGVAWAADRFRRGGAGWDDAVETGTPWFPATPWSEGDKSLNARFADSATERTRFVTITDVNKHAH